ncbi:hypothetical protein R1flu_013555 [Riccia fluitans]|uniref:Uncharacterized protein n=1 Tax=Riccia fluitans TaxID=41844 RepID=A0ABD1YH46_9MARC
MRIKKDGQLVEPLDPDVDAKSQKISKKKQTGSEEPSRKRPRSESDPKDGNERNLPSAVETLRKGKEKVTKSSHLPDVDTDVDRPAEERRTLKIGMTACRLEMDPPLSTSTRQTFGRGSNHIAIGDTTKEVPPTPNKLPSDGVMEESVNQMTTMLSNILEHHGRHRTLQDEVDQTGIDVYYQFLLHALKAAAGTLPNSLVVFEYIWSIFDSYINPTNDPNVQPLVKGLDADDFSIDKFFSLQDPTSPDDIQASPDFEEDLRTNERLRLRAEVRNLEAKLQRVTRSIRICLDYEPTILPDVPPTDNPTRPITLDLTVDAREDPSSSAQS